MKNKKIIIVAFIVVLVIGIYFYYKKKKAAAPTTSTASKSLDTHFNVQPLDTSNDNFPLSEKSKGTRVETLQRALNRLIEKQNTFGLEQYPVLVIDGSFGAKTTAAILKAAGVAYYSNKGMTETQFNSLIELSNK